MISIAIGSDHRGTSYKSILQESVHDELRMISWVDVGCFQTTLCDYPIYAKAAVDLMRNKTVERAVLLCGSGVGMAVAANRFAGIYAGVAWNERVAVDARSDDGINVLVIPADYVTAPEAIAITVAWLATAPKGGKYERRVQMIDEFGGR